MKIICFGVSNIAGGIENVVSGMYEYIPRDKYKIDFVTFFPSIYKEEELKKGGSVIYYLTARGTDYRRHHQEVKEFFKNHGREYDCLWLNCATLSSGHIVKEAKRAGISKIVLHGHAAGLEVSHPLKRIYHIFLHKINQYRLMAYQPIKIACSKASGEFFYGKRPCIILENGVEIEEFTFSKEAREQLRNKYKIEEDRQLIGVGARFVPVKNLFFLLEVFAAYHSKYKESMLVLIGTGQLEDQLKECVRELGLEEDVLFTGYQKDMARYLSMLDIYTLPSLIEGYPVSAIEAQCSGLYGIISERVTGEVIKTDRFLHISIDHGVDRWVQALEKMPKPPFDRENQWQEMERLGCSMEKMTQKFLNILEQGK